MSGSGFDAGHDAYRALKRMAQAGRSDFQYLLIRHGNLSFLGRLANSEYRARFILKGAHLLDAWMDIPHRSTRDLDFMMMKPGTIEGLTVDMARLAQGHGDQDGLRIDPAGTRIRRIRMNSPYPGFQVRLAALIGPAHLTLHLDLVSGDAISPAPEQTTIPALLTSPGPSILAYTPQTFLAEKLETAVRLGTLNTRMKDFHDMHSMTRRMRFHGQAVLSALRATARCRRWHLDAASNSGLLPGLAEDANMERQWTTYAQRSRESSLPGWRLLMQDLTGFWEPVLRRSVDTSQWNAEWQPGGPWMIPASPR